jgi:Complex 1 protein (LYR family)
MFKPADIRALHRQLLRAGSVATWPSSKNKGIVWTKIRAGFDEHRHEQDLDNLKVLVDNGKDSHHFLFPSRRSKH